MVVIAYDHKQCTGIASIHMFCLKPQASFLELVPHLVVIQSPLWSLVPGPVLSWHPGDPGLLSGLVQSPKYGHDYLFKTLVWF